MTRLAVKVCVRTRPTSHFASSEIEIAKDGRSITVRPSVEVRDPHAPNNQAAVMTFPVHNVLHNVSQETVYSTYCSEIVQSAIDGVNGSIFSYGQTGSGKTFTMVGDTSNYLHRGIIPRSIAQIFSEVAARPSIDFKVTCTYMEIYNEKIYDLIDDMKSPPTSYLQQQSSQKASHRTEEFKIVEDKGGRGVYVKGLTEVEIFSEQEALNYLFQGELRRTTAGHILNRKSNRSHSLFTVYIQQKPKTGINDKIITSKLNLVDLAGSERLKKTMEATESVDGSTTPVDTTTKKESMYINKSLSYLEQVVIALLRKSYVPYRQCRLTTLLKDSIGGNGVTLMLACMWGEASQLEETISTLRFASRMTKVQNKANINTVIDPNQLIRKQEKLIKELKQELLMHDAIADRGSDTIVYDPYTPEQQTEIRNMVEKYLRASADEEDIYLSFQSVRQMREMCHQFKVIVKMVQDSIVASGGKNKLGGVENEVIDGVFNNLAAASRGSLTVSEGDTDEIHSKLFNNNGETVGKLEEGHGFILGRGNDNARPASSSNSEEKRGVPGSRGTLGIEATTPTPSGAGTNVSDNNNYNSNTHMVSPKEKQKVDFISPHSGKAITGAGDTIAIPENPNTSNIDGGKERAYQVYREGPGASTNEKICDIKEALKTEKKTYRQLSNSINQAKRAIDDINYQLKIKADEKSKYQTPILSKDIVDEEEFALIKKLKETKKHYKVDFDAYLDKKEKVENLEDQLDDLRSLLYEKFEYWYKDALRSKKAGNNVITDKLDDSELFEKMELDAQSPEAIAYFQARKTMQATQTQNSVLLRKEHRNKRK